MRAIQTNTLFLFHRQSKLCRGQYALDLLYFTGNVDRRRDIGLFICGKKSSPLTDTVFGCAFNELQTACMVLAEKFPFLGSILLFYCLFVTLINRNKKEAYNAKKQEAARSLSRRKII